MKLRLIVIISCLVVLSACVKSRVSLISVKQGGDTFFITYQNRGTSTGEGVFWFTAQGKDYCESLHTLRANEVKTIAIGCEEMIRVIGTRIPYSTAFSWVESAQTQTKIARSKRRRANPL